MKLLIKIIFLRRIYDDVTTFWKRWNLGTKSTQEESFFFFFHLGYDVLCIRNLPTLSHCFGIIVHAVLFKSVFSQWNYSHYFKRAKPCKNSS